MWFEEILVLKITSSEFVNRAQSQMAWRQPVLVENQAQLNNIIYGRKIDRSSKQKIVQQIWKADN